ncbi:MAG TPA: hypothetical protein VG222_02080 [Vicinamibacterales bacterium]|nr:hypothetical protein [Vicinamibacterales bacterium]
MKAKKSRAAVSKKSSRERLHPDPKLAALGVRANADLPALYKFVKELKAEAVHTSLTTDERDAIDTAKRRIRTLTALLALVLDQDDADEDPDVQLGVLDLLDVVNEDARVLDTVFAAVDQRTGAGGAR